MAQPTPKAALEELRAAQGPLKKKVRIAFIALLAMITPILVFFPTQLSGAGMQAFSVLAAIALFGWIFSGRVAIFIQKRQYGTRMPYEWLLLYSEPEDLELSVAESLAQVEKRRLEAESR